MNAITVIHIYETNRPQDSLDTMDQGELRNIASHPTRKTRAYPHDIRLLIEAAGYVLEDLDRRGLDVAFQERLREAHAAFEYKGPRR